jgi:hypothetical protein
MPDTGLKRSPKFQKGALVQIVPTFVDVEYKIIPFQYNPETLSHSLTPWNPFEVDQTQRGAQSPNVQPFDPKESFTLTLEIDATDDLEDSEPAAVESGIAGRLAALKKLTLPSEGGNEELVRKARATTRAASEHATRSTVPVLLFVWGPGRILPVRVTSFSVEETLFSPSLFTIQATVSLGLEVLTPDVFKCHPDEPAKKAIAAYQFTKQKENERAEAHINNNVDQIRALLSF